jgi:hypothetical protein
MERGPYSMKPSFTAIRRVLPAGALLLLAVFAVRAQTTGVIQGVIKDDSGPVASPVHVAAVNPAIGGKSYTAVTGSNGAFSISGVAPGTYSICVQEPGGAHIDACQWSTPVQIKVAAGQTVSNASILAVKGTLLQVRVNDPGGLWKGGRGNPEVLIGVILPSSLFRPMRLVSSDAGGKTFDVAIPSGTPVKMSVTAPHFAISDSQGLSLGAVVAPVQAAAGQASLPVTYTITGKK